MRKYFQITFFLGGFFLLVILKNLKGNDSGNHVIGTPQQQNLITSQTPSPSVSLPTQQTTAGPVKTTVAPLQTATAAPTKNLGQYKDGAYTGSVEDVYYGNYQVQAIISGGKLTDINFLQYPNDNRTSRSINSQAMPILKSEAIAQQNAQVDIVSGASDSSAGFQKSLDNALKQAKT